VATLLAHLDNDLQGLQSLLAEMLKRRDQWLRHVATADDPVQSRTALEAALRNVILDSTKKAQEAVPEEVSAELAAVTAAAGANLLAEGRDGPARQCIGRTRLPEPDSLEGWLGIADTLLTKSGAWRKKLTVTNGFPASDKALKRRGEELLSAFGNNEPLRIALAELPHLPDRQFTEPQWQVLAALVKLLPVAAEQLQIRFRERGAADYLEIAMAARRALGGAGRPTDLALGIDCQIRHILIDEFQDTSVSQYSLLELLTAGWKPGDGRTIFAVGDPMQSIYRFREAQVGLFLKACREGLGDLSLEPLQLSANFRSGDGIVDWVNATFPGVMPQEEDVTTGAISFRASIAVHDSISAPAVTLHPFIGRNDEAEAARVVDLVRSAQAVKGAKVAILVRARSHVNHILSALRAASLRFRAVEIDRLAEAPVIQDLAALTRALLHPADRIAWLALLRAPWCGLTLEELHVLVEGDLRTAVWDLMRSDSRLERIRSDGQKRLSRVRSVLETAFANRPASLRAWMEGVWMALGGPACTAGTTEIENAGAFFDLLAGMDEGGRFDLAEFQQRLEDLYANPDSAADDSLQVMTIHKAKGLEFDVVIVPGLGRKPRSDEASLMLWLERPRLGGNPDLLLAPIYATGSERDQTYGYLKRIDALKSEYESGRLLYVAATRAKSQLHLLGHTSYGMKDGSVEVRQPLSSSLLRRMWAVAEPVFQAAAQELPVAPDHATAPVGRKPQVLRRLTLDWQLPSPPPAVTLSGQAAAGESERSAVSFHWVGDTLRHVGTVVHQMLRRIAEDGVAEWDADRVGRHRPAYLSALASLGVPVHELAPAADRVVMALERTLSDERGRWLLAIGHDNAACEYRLCGMIEGEMVSARIDRTFIDEQGTRWVIDYKSSSHEGAGVQAFLDNERERYREQLVRYKRLFAGLEDRPVRAGLYFPLLNAWRELGGD
ncbi:MAG: 3'-5' exonuclease, partial [Acidobacteriota bacterium]